MNTEQSRCKLLDFVNTRVLSDYDALEETGQQYYDALEEFEGVLSPATVIALLDRIEAAEKVCDAAVRYCNPDDDDVCYLDFLEIVEIWQQEVTR